MPGAGHVQAGADGGELRGGAPRVVWQTLETDPRLVSARSAAECLDRLGRCPHLVWNPLSGEIVQLIPVLRAGRGLGGRGGLIAASACPQADTASVNTEGRLCVQIGVIGSARDPFTSGPMTGVDLILTWLDTWRIPRSWPAGPPAAHAYEHGPRSRRLWARGGHFGGSQVPDCYAAGPGAIDIERFTEPAMEPAQAMQAVQAVEAAELAIELSRTRDFPVPRLDKATTRGTTQIHLGRLHEPEPAEAQLTSMA
jgi:hypothetical protein